MKKQKLVCSFAYIVFVVLACALTAAAQKSSIAITPASIDSVVRAGASYTQNFTLSNNTTERLRFRCSVSDMWFNEQNQRLNGRAGTLPRSASQWVQFSPSELTVEPGSSAVVKVTITIPNLATGSFYTVPVFEAAPDLSGVKPISDTASIASIGIRFRGLVMLTTDKGAEYNVELMSATVVPPSASSELELAVDIRNRGTAHVFTRGSYAILDSAGNLVGRGKIDKKRFLPDQRNVVKSNWSGVLKPGLYTCLVTLGYDRVGQDPVSLVHELTFQVR